MTPFRDLCKEDASLFSKYIETGDFPLANIAANRLLSDLVLSDDQTALLLGCLLKDVATTFLIVKATPDANPKPYLGKAKDVASACITSLSTNPIESKDVWRAYVSFVQQTREGLADPLETTIYTKSPEVSLQVTMRVASFVGKHLPDAGKALNLFGGGLNEIDRIQKAVGCTDASTLLEVHLNALQRAQVYAVMDSQDGDKIDSKSLEGILSQLAGKSFDFYNSCNTSEINPAECTDVLDSIVRTTMFWREGFLRWMEVGVQATSPAKRTPLTDEERRRLTQSVAEVLKKPKAVQK